MSLHWQDNETGLLPNLIVITVASLFLFLCPVGSSYGIQDTEKTRKATKQKLNTEIEKSQIKIQRLQSGLESQREGIERAKLKEKSVLAELKELDQRLFKMAARLQELQTRKTNQQELISSKERELDVIKEKTLDVQQHMQRRITAYYKLGKIDIINITFSTKTLPELLRFYDSFEAVLVYDQELIKQYKDISQELESTRQALTLEKGLLDEFITQAAESEQKIRDTRNEKETLLHRIQTQAVLHEQAIKELESAKSGLKKTLLDMKKKKTYINKGFLISKRKHIPPVKGKILSLFNEEKENQFGIKRRSPGISISASDGTRVRAIFDGKVIYSGYLKGYGNTVIIDHGYQYFTISSRIERLLARKGTKIKRNAIIGIMGSTATILDEGLYFEVRHKDKPLNPLEWLDTKKLTFAEGKRRL